MNKNKNEYSLRCAENIEDAKVLKNFVLNYYIPLVKTAKRSWKDEKRNLERYILPSFGMVPLADISTQSLMDWVGMLEQAGLSYSSRFRMFWLFKGVLNCAVRWGALENDNAFRSARLSARPGRRPELLSHGDLLRLFDILKQHHHRSSADAIRLMLLTGAGKSEILNARWDDVDLERGILTTDKTFTGRTRSIPLNSEALKLVGSLPRQEGVPWLFFSRNGTRLANVARQWGQIREKLGRPELRLQDLRHNFANILMEEGVHQKDLKVILGHYKIETLELARSRSLERKGVSS